jgi:hypothetical protein
MIIRNYAINLILFAQLAERPSTAMQACLAVAGLPRCGGSMTYDQIISNASVYHMLSCFLIFTGAIADIHNA